MRPLIAGVTEAGPDALPEMLQQRLQTADCIIAAPRFHDSLPQTAEILDWPKPFSNIYNMIEERADKSLVILTTGDPMWFGAGASLVRALGPEGCEVVPAVSGLQLAAAALGWPLASCGIVSIHGRPLQTVRPALHPRARLLVIAQDEDSPAKLASWLQMHGFGGARLHVLANLGGPAEACFDGTAAAWPHGPVPAFHIIGVDCADCDGAVMGIAAPDSAFENDGKLTKRDVRASALAKLRPFPGAVLWDIGSGSGAVSIDFLRAAGRGTAYAIDQNPAQMEMARRNATSHGVAGMEYVEAVAAQALEGLADPDAVFIGGGLSSEVISKAQERMRPGGVLVAHAVTIESESLIVAAWQQTGGDLARISVQHADPVGGFHGWRPLMPVTQWHWVKEARA